MVQMVGVIVLSLGLQPMFESIDRGGTLDNRVMVAGYVIMRVALVFLWWQVSRHDRDRAPAARSYMTTIGVAQVGWVVLAVLELGDRRELRAVRRADRLRALRPVPRRAQGATPRGTRTTSPSATACWSSSRSARSSSARSPRSTRSSTARRAGPSTRCCWPSPASASPSAAGGCTSRVPWGEVAGPPPRARVQLRLRPPGHLRRAGRDGGRPARRGLHPRGRGEDRPHRRGAQRGHPLRRLRRDVLRALLGAHARLRPVPRRSRRGHHRAARPVGGPRRRRA